MKRILGSIIGGLVGCVTGVLLFMFFYPSQGHMTFTAEIFGLVIGAPVGLVLGAILGYCFARILS